MSIKKRFLKKRPVCKVTFRLTADVAGQAQYAAVVGEFNDWDARATPMKRLKSGDFKATLELPVEHGYQFRYLVDRRRWITDTDADAQVAAPFPDARNSLVTT